MEEKARAACHSRACGGSLSPQADNGDRLTNGRRGARPHHRQLEAPHVEKYLMSRHRVPAWSLGRLCLFLLWPPLTSRSAAQAAMRCWRGWTKSNREMVEETAAERSLAGGGNLGRLSSGTGTWPSSQWARVPFMTRKRAKPHFSLHPARSRI